MFFLISAVFQSRWWRGKLIFRRFLRNKRFLRTKKEQLLEQENYSASNLCQRAFAKSLIRLCIRTGARAKEYDPSNAHQQEQENEECFFLFQQENEPNGFFAPKRATTWTRNLFWFQPLSTSVREESNQALYSHERTSKGILTLVTHTNKSKRMRNIFSYFSSNSVKVMALKINLSSVSSQATNVRMCNVENRWRIQLNKSFRKEQEG